MDAAAFWEVSASYNWETWPLQLLLLLFLTVMIFLSYGKKVRWTAKFALGIGNLYIGIGFFAAYGTQPIQHYFALPIFLLCGILFLYESWKNRDDIPTKPNFLQIILLLRYLLYPLVSLLLGNRFPRMVTHIMPCPLVSLSIAVYTGYHKKNRFLLILLTIWGLTGIKSLFFNAYEDLILLLSGLCATARLAKDFHSSGTLV